LDVRRIREREPWGPRGTTKAGARREWCGPHSCGSRPNGFGDVSRLGIRWP
jgi:hypothetical protein